MSTMNMRTSETEFKYRVLMYFLISAFITPMPIFVPVVGAVSNTPTWSSNWNAVGERSGQFTLYFSSSLYESYKYTVWVKQFRGETDPFFDYYGVVVRFYSDFEHGTVNPTEVETKVQIIIEPTDTSYLFPNGGPEEWEKDQGEYDSWSGIMTVIVTYGSLSANVSIGWDITQLKIEVATGDNEILWKNTRTWWGSMNGVSALGSYEDERCIAIMSVPDASRNGGENPPPDDGNLYVYFYVKGYTFIGGVQLYSSASTYSPRIDVIDVN